MLGKVFSFFSGLKITAIMGGVIAVLFGWIKLKNQKIENLEEENIMFQKKGHITDEMNEAKKQAEVKREEAIKDINTDNWRDSI